MTDRPLRDHRATREAIERTIRESAILSSGQAVYEPDAPLEQVSELFAARQKAYAVAVEDRIDALSRFYVRKHQDARPRRGMAKAVLDRTLAFVLLVLCVPLLVVVAVVVRYESDGPILLRTVRLGRGGQVFRLLKFRTMKAAPLVDPWIGDGRYPVIREEVVLTRVGRFLRRTGLDELPELFAVMKGDMSLVGPRPHPPGALDPLDTETVGRLLAVRPGVISPAAIGMSLAETLRAEVNYASRGPSLRRDLRVLLSTVKTMSRREVPVVKFDDYEERGARVSDLWNTRERTAS